MNKVAARVGTVALMLWAIISTAHALDVDWKVYGWASIAGDSTCLYDAKGVVRRSDGHIRVWTKCLLDKDIGGIDTKTEPGKTILENSAQKVARYYVPPIAIVEESIDNADKAAEITWAEESANIAHIEPVAEILYEINCSENMMQELSISLRDKNGKRGYVNKPRDWKYISPEGNGARLLKILCPPRE